jgi:hypothetical protein
MGGIKKDTNYRLQLSIVVDMNKNANHIQLQIGTQIIDSLHYRLQSLRWSYSLSCYLV